MSKLSNGIVKAEKWVFEISEKTSESDLLQSDVSGQLHRLVHNGDYRSYYTDPNIISGKVFVLRMYFEKGILISIDLSPVSGIPSWDNVEKNELLKEKAINDEWLKNEFSIISPANYQWGTLESVLDQKSGSSSIVIRYRR